MTRLPQWEKHLRQWVEQACRTPFEWGGFDCALMAASAVEAITGEHPAPDLVGAYYTPLGAYRVLLEHDGLTGLCDERFPRIPVARARRGDLVLGRFGRKETLMVCIGEACVVAGEDRPQVMPRRELKQMKAWRIG